MNAEDIVNMWKRVEKKADELVAEIDVAVKETIAHVDRSIAFYKADLFLQAIRHLAVEYDKARKEASG